MSNANVIKVSIIVPAFNVELYLGECLDSLIIQTLKDIEIIVIDDGSTDQTGKIADAYAERDTRIKVIHQENQGLAAARNRGINMVRGRYIAFVDSDDWVEPDAYERLYECANHTDADMVLGSIVCFKKGKKSYQMGDYSAIFKDEQILSGKEALTNLIQTDSYFPMVYMNLYRTELILCNRLYFKYLYHEDEYLTPYLFFYAEKIVCLEGAFYHYRLREGSIMHSAEPRIRANCYVGIANELFEFVENLLKNEKKEILVALLRQACCLLLRAIRIYIFLKKKGIQVGAIPLLKCYKLNLWREYLGNNKGRDWLYYCILNEQRKFLLVNYSDL